MFILHIFVVNIKFPRAIYHTIVPSTEELYCLNIYQLGANQRRLHVTSKKSVIRLVIIEAAKRNF